MTKLLMMTEMSFVLRSRNRMLRDGDSLEDEIKEYSSEEESDDSSDDEGWITPGNVDEVNKIMTGGTGDSDTAACTVGCLTTDFAMQVGLGESN